MISQQAAFLGTDNYKPDGISLRYHMIGKYPLLQQLGLSIPAQQRSTRK